MEHEVGEAVAKGPVVKDEAGPKSAPQLAVGVVDLSHARVVAGQRADGLRCIWITHTEDVGDSTRGDVEALAEWEVDVASAGGLSDAVGVDAGLTRESGDSVRLGIHDRTG